MKIQSKKNFVSCIFSSFLIFRNIICHEVLKEHFHSKELVFQNLQQFDKTFSWSKFFSCVGFKNASVGSSTNLQKGGKRDFVQFCFSWAKLQLLFFAFFSFSSFSLFSVKVVQLWGQWHDKDERGREKKKGEYGERETIWLGGERTEQRKEKGKWGELKRREKREED